MSGAASIMANATIRAQEAPVTLRKSRRNGDISGLLGWTLFGTTIQEKIEAGMTSLVVSHWRLADTHPAGLRVKERHENYALSPKSRPLIGSNTSIPVNYRRPSPTALMKRYMNSRPS